MPQKYASPNYDFAYGYAFARNESKSPGDQED
jgi:hypothetical protein